MNKPWLAAALLLNLALLAHLFVGTRETMSLKPAEETVGLKPAEETMSLKPLDERRQRWLQALGVFQRVTVDLLLLTVVGYLLAATEVFGTARRSVAIFMAAYLFAWTMAWLLQLRLAGARGKSYLLLGQCLLFSGCAGLLLWGS